MTSGVLAARRGATSIDSLKQTALWHSGTLVSGVFFLLDFCCRARRCRLKSAGKRKHWSLSPCDGRILGTEVRR